MDKVFGLFTKKRRKENFPCTPFDQLPVQIYKNYEFDSENSSVSCSDNLIYAVGNKLGNDLSLTEDNSKPCLINLNLENISSDVKASREQKTSLEKTDKSTKNMHVISIRNCRYFHIGPQETINVLGSVGHIKESWSSPLDLDLLLDCHQKISEESIMVISLHMGDKWKKFGIILQLKEKYLEEVNFRNDGNTILTTFDILQNYIGLFPKTSVGFIVSVLYEIKQMEIIREIAKSKISL